MLLWRFEGSKYSLGEYWFLGTSVSGIDLMGWFYFSKIPLVKYILGHYQLNILRQ